MSDVFEKRIAALEKQVRKQQTDIDKLWENFKRLMQRTDQLRKAVPHMNLGEW